jgi:hypothetical protein
MPHAAFPAQAPDQRDNTERSFARGLIDIENAVHS